jgi:enoyl-CoA hydratase/carnithine racemase
MAPPKWETVTVSIDDGIATVKYNRPNNANALSPQVMADLSEAFRYVNGESSVRVVVYTGEGKFFTVRYNLSRIFVAYLGVGGEAVVIS